MHEMLARNHELAGRIDGNDFPQVLFERLQGWQQKRISITFDDLIRQTACRPAIKFFLSELYGGLGFRKRDQDISRVMPVMRRFLSDKVLFTMSEAFELQAVSLEFDIEMALQMERLNFQQLDMDRYCELYRSCGDKPGRERQILLIRRIGYELDELVNKPLVNTLVRLLRGPAHAAGFGELQEFLESGLGSFRALDDVRYFNETIYQREWKSMQKLFAGVEKPFGF